jgi:hypothetical protein
MLAWAHFTLTELRPLYALFYVLYLLTQRMAMDAYVLRLKRSRRVLALRLVPEVRCVVFLLLLVQDV